MSNRDDLARLRAPASYLRDVLACLAPEPDQRRKIFARAGVTERDIETGDGMMTLATQAALVAACNEIIGPDWSVRTEPAWSAASQGALEVAMRSSQTVLDALLLVARYGRVRGPQFIFGLKRLSGGAALSIDPAVQIDAVLYRPMCEAAVFGVKSVGELLLQERPVGFTYEWAWAAPPYRRELETTLGGECRFDCMRTRVIAPESVLSARSPYADKDLNLAAIATLEAALAAFEEPSIAGRLSAVFRRANGDLPGADAAAAALGMSRRTLARRLAAEGTSYREARDAALKDLAAKLIADGALSRDKIAAQLGFEDPTSFSRACRRWFGGSMRAVRAKASASE